MAPFLAQLKRRWILVTAIIAIVAIGWFFLKGNEPRVNSSKTYKVTEGTIQESLSLSGEINAHEMAVLRFQTSGRLNWVGVKEGDYVKKYQGIASLDVRDVKNKLTQYLNSYVSERDDYDQSLDDNLRTINEGATELARDAAKRLLNKAQNDLDNSVLAVELQKLAQEYAYLYTPVEGVVVSAQSPLPGVNVTPSQAEFIIINPNTLYFSATADQTDVVNLHEGMTGGVTFDSFPDKAFTGEVESISFTPDKNETGTVYRIKVAVTPQLDELRMGMTGDISFPVGAKRKILQVPSTVIKTEKDTEYVVIQENGKKVKRVIQSGENFDDMTEVVSGLKKGELVYDPR